jgi:hypothetical protein
MIVYCTVIAKLMDTVSIDASILAPKGQFFTQKIPQRKFLNHGT